MKMVIMQENDDAELIKDLELTKFTISSYSLSNLKERLKLTDEDLKFLVADIHSCFHYRVVNWLQKHGFKGLK